MNCNVLKHKEASLNARQTLINEGVIPDVDGIRRIVSTMGKFDEVVNKMNADASFNYNVKLPLFTKEKMGDEWYVVGNPEAFKQIDDKRKELGIYESREPIGLYFQRQIDELYKGESPIDIYNQLEGLPSSRASEETIKRVLEAGKKIGIDFQSLSKYAKEQNYDVTSINGLADLIHGIVAIAEGKEDRALVEEMVHITTAIIEQVEPRMMTEMISKIDRFKIYQKTLDAYKNDKRYQLPNGKPNIRKIKKEAVDKLITELIIKDNDGDTEFPELREETNRSWVRNTWNRVMDKIRGWFKSSNVDIFERAAESIAKGDISGDVTNIQTRDVFLQKVTDPQESLMDKLAITRDTIIKTESGEKVDPILQDTEEASNWYDVILPNGAIRRAANRVTDRVKDWYAEKFRNKTFTEEEKKFNELKREIGVDSHALLQDIHGRFYEPNGMKKNKADKRPVINDSTMDAVYDKLEKYYMDLIKMFPKDTLILSEQVIYDPAEDEAGTLDFMAIEPSGKVHILDWKFMYINKERTDVAWYKQEAYNIQLGRYKQILKDVYGVKDFGMTRAIPFLMEFKLKNKFNPDLGFKLGGIVAGSADPSQIEDLRLTPVPEKTESTGEEELDILISKLYALLDRISEETVTEEEREFKRERLNILRQTIRIIQATSNISPLIDTIEVMRREGDRILNEYETIYKDMPATSRDKDNRALSDFSDDARNYMELASIFAGVSNDIGELIYSEEMEASAKTKAQKEEIKERKQLAKKLADESSAIYRSSKAIKKATMAFADKHIGQRNTTTGLLDPKRVVKGMGSFFQGISEIPLPSLEILYKVNRAALGNAAQDALAKVKQIMDIRERIMKKGGDPKESINRIYQKDDKDKKVNKLVFKFSGDFRKEVDNKHLQGGDRRWLLDNIDVDAYMAEAKKVIKMRIDQIKKESLPGDKKEVEAQRKKYIEQVYRQYDITRIDFNGGDNYLVKRYPLPKWYSEEYKEISKDPDLLELYNFISDFNEIATEVGYIENNVTKTFLPFVRKTMAEGLAWENVLSAISRFGDNLIIRPDAIGRGAIDQITGEMKNAVPKYYTYDFTRGEDGVNDYSDVSEDIFKNLILYVQHVYNYKYLTEAEGQVKLVKTIEEFKNHYATDNLGNVILDDNGEPIEEKGNKENAKLFENYMKVLFYGQKNVTSATDTAIPIGNVKNFIKNAINKVAGRTVYTIDENPTAISLLETMDAANRGFQIKTLGFEMIPGLVNLFGGTRQLAAQSGFYFKFPEYKKNFRKIASLEFENNDEKTAFVEMINLFMPLKDDPSRELYKKAGMSKLTNVNVGDTLMITMSYPEMMMEKSVFLTLLENSFVKNGKIVNIPAFVRNKYKDRYNSGSKFAEMDPLINKEIEEMKKTQSIWATKKIVDGKLEIPGLDLSNREEIQKLTNLARTTSRNAMGGTSDGNVSQAQMNAWLRAAMVFKGWIPKLFATRFTELKRVTDDFTVTINEDGIAEGQRYEIGRMRALAYVWMKSFRDKATTLSDIINATDRGINALDELYLEYAKKYKTRTGERFTMSREDFMDMMRDSLRNQIRELQLLGALLGAALALKFMAPDDDEDRATKNFFRFSQRIVDKFVSELSFFYNPLEFEKILSGNMFPAIGLVNDQLKFATHFWLETTGLDLSDPTKSYEEVVKDAKPVKYAMKAAPILKSALTYGAILSEDFAKEMDITIQKESSIR
jgi:hypothetical protein